MVLKDHPLFKKNLSKGEQLHFARQLLSLPLISGACPAQDGPSRPT